MIMETYQNNINKELTNINNDKIIFEHELKMHRDNIAHMLKTDMGKDIDDVLSGKKIVKLSFFEKFKYKAKYYINILFNTF